MSAAGNNGGLPGIALEAAPKSSHNDRFVGSFNYVLKKAGFFDAAQTDPYETYKHLDEEDKLKVCEAYFQCHQEDYTVHEPAGAQGDSSVTGYEVRQDYCDGNVCSPPELRIICQTIGTLLATNHYRGFTLTMQKICWEADNKKRDWGDLVRVLKNLPDVVARTMLMQQNGDCNETPLIIASNSAPLNVIKELLAIAPGAATLKNDDGWTPLHVAVLKNKKKMSAAIIRAAPITCNIRDEDKLTPFGYASSDDMRILVLDSLLLSCRDGKYADAEGLRDQSSYRDMRSIALMMAFEAGELNRLWSDLTEYISLLPISAAQFQCSLQDGYKKWTLLHIAVKYIAPNDVIELILSKAPDAAAQSDSYGKLPLHYAAASNNSDAVQLLLESYCHAARVPDNVSRIPLYSAMKGIDMEEDDIRVIKQLVVEFPAGVAHRDKKGNLPARKIFENADDAATFFNYIDKEMREKRYKAEELVSSFIVEFVQRNDEVDWNFIVTMPTWFQREAVTQKVLQEQLNKNISTRPGTFIVLLDSFLAIAVVFVFRQLSIEVLSGEKQDHTSSNQAKTVFLYLTWFYLFFREAMQIKLLREKDRVIQYFDFSNILDFVSLILLLIFLVSLNFVGSSNPDSPARIFVSILTAVLWLQVLDTLTLLFLPFAKFVTGLVQVIRSLLPFILSLAIMVIAFAQMFSIIFYDSTLCDFDLNDLQDDVQVVRADFCLGYYSPEIYLRSYEMLSNFDINAFRGSRASIAIYVAFTFLIIIIVLNGVIIALVSSFYDDYKKQATQLFWLERLNLAVELEDTLIKPLRPMLSHMNGFFEDAEAKHGWGEGLFGALLLSYDDSRHNRRTRNHFFETYDVNGWHHVVQARLTWLTLDPSDPLHKVNISFTRWAGFIIIPLWFTVGLLSLGILWPPQLRECLGGPLETEEEEEDLNQPRVDHENRSQAAQKSKEDVDDTLAIIISDIAELKNMLSRAS